MKRNLLYLFAAFLFVLIGISILVHLKSFFAFLPESVVFGPQIPAYETPSQSYSEFNDGHKTNGYLENGKQGFRYSYENGKYSMFKNSESSVKKSCMVK